MPPKSATSAKPVSEGTRKSSRVASLPPKVADVEAKKPASKAKAPASKKRTADEAVVDEKPVSKKSKPSSTVAPAKPKSTTKPKSTGNGNGVTTEPAAKPASKATKPKSTASKPASKSAKPASAAKPKSATATKNKKNEEKEAIEEEKDAEASAEEKPTTGGAKELGLGDKLPKIVLPNNKGAEVDVSKIVNKDTGLVFFLYPKADTPGCTTQACGYRDVYPEFEKLGYKVYGLSKDSPASQDKWATKKTFQYELLCDPESKLIKKLGAFVAPNSTKRSHFIFEKGSGKLIDKVVGVKPAEDPKHTLDFIKKHHKA